MDKWYLTIPLCIESQFNVNMHTHVYNKWQTRQPMDTISTIFILKLNIDIEIRYQYS